MGHGLNESALDTLMIVFVSRTKHCMLPERIKALRRWSQKILEQVQLFLSQLTTEDSLDSFHSRMFMLYDHYYFINRKAISLWETPVTLCANTNKQGKPKQMLDQHRYAYEQAKKTALRLPMFEQGLPVTDNISTLKTSSPGKYRWQDKAARKVAERDRIAQGKENAVFLP